MDNLKPTTEDMEIRDTEVEPHFDDRFESDPQNPEYKNKPETGESIEDENIKEEIDPIIKFISENRGVNKEDLKLENADDDRYVFDGKQILDKKDGTSLTEKTRNLTDTIQIQAHEALLQSLAENPEQAFMLLDHEEKTENGRKTYFTVAKMDKEGNVRFEIHSYEEKKEKEKEEKPIKKVEEIKIEEETLDLDIDVEKEETEEIEALSEESLPIEMEAVNEQESEMTEAIIKEQGKSTAKPETTHIDVVEDKIEQKAEKTMTLEDKIMDLLKDESANLETPPLSNEKNVVAESKNIEQKAPIVLRETASIKETIIEKPREEVEMPEIKITQTETIEQNHIIEVNKQIVSSEVLKKVVNLEKEIKDTTETKDSKPEAEIVESETKPVELVDTEIISPYIKQPILEQKLETVLASNSAESQELTTESVVIEAKPETNEKIVETKIRSTEIPLILDEDTRAQKKLNENIISKGIEISKNAEEENLPKNKNEMLLRILGVPIIRNERVNETNINESMQTKPIPYSSEESDNSTSLKPMSSQPKATLNGITLKRAA